MPPRFSARTQLLGVPAGGDLPRRLLHLRWFGGLSFAGGCFTHFVSSPFAPAKLSRAGTRLAVRAGGSHQQFALALWRKTAGGLVICYQPTALVFVVGCFCQPAELPPGRPFGLCFQFVLAVSTFSSTTCVFLEFLSISSLLCLFVLAFLLILPALRFCFFRVQNSRFC